MEKKGKILWIDLEMTGLDSQKDHILEVAAIITDWDFNEIALYHKAVFCDEKVLKTRMEANGDFWRLNPNAEKALNDQNKTASPSSIVEQELIDLVKQNFNDDDQIILGGNSIHMDRRFISAWWPKLDDILYYRMLDVSAWKLVFENKYNISFFKPEVHRALDDIRGSIDELKFYLKKFRMN